MSSYADKLIEIYRKAQQRLIALIAYKEARGNVTWYQETLLEQVQDELRRLNAYNADWAREAITESYYTGATSTTSTLGDMGVTVRGVESFARLHVPSVEVLVRNTESMLFNATAFVGRQVEDVVRKAGLEAIALKQATGATVREAARLVKKNLIDEGVNGIRDRRGRTIALDAYASTVARSTTREATNTGLLNQLDYEGYDLVQMSSHATTCAVCAAYQGRVYSVSGRTRGYPTLDLAFSNGHANIHPNCRHVIMPYIRDLADDPEGDQAFSNRPFDMDPRSKAEIERYRQDQADKRRLREDRNQFDRYRLAMGDKAPKTFAAFRRIKNADGERWSELQAGYRRTRAE